MTDPVPFYKQPKFLITAGTIAILSGLAIWAIIAPEQYLDAVQMIFASYMGAPQ